MTKKTRGRVSKVDLLPPSIRDQLNTLLRDKRHTQDDARDAINQLIDEHGLGDDAKISRTGLNRYASKMEEVGAKIRQSREVAEAWCAKLGNEPTSDVGKILQEIVKTLAFEAGTSMMESGKPIEPKALSQMALLAQRLEQAAMTNMKREQELLAAFTSKAAAEVEKVAKSAGLTAETAAEIKRGILGIA